MIYSLQPSFRQTGLVGLHEQACNILHHKGKLHSKDSKINIISACVANHPMLQKQASYLESKLGTQLLTGLFAN